MNGQPLDYQTPVPPKQRRPRVGLVALLLILSPTLIFTIIFFLALFKL